VEDLSIFLLIHPSAKVVVDQHAVMATIKKKFVRITLCIKKLQTYFAAQSAWLIIMNRVRGCALLPLPDRRD
jgi:hypothetical protein